MLKYLCTCAAIVLLSCQAKVSHPPAPALTIPWVVHEDEMVKDSIYFTAAEVDSMPIIYPEFFQRVFTEPDTAYFHAKRLHSEVDQDYYYRLYGYFLRQKNGVEKFAERRVQLIKVMWGINTLERIKAEGGTYFGHMYPRIEGYAEYELQQPWEEIPFSKVRKDSFILVLHQSLKFSEFELHDDSTRLSKAKSGIQEIDTLISSNAFLLDQAIKFHRARYQY